MDQQLTLFETQAPCARSVWGTLSADERAAAVCVLARLMAKAVADLGDHHPQPEDGHD